MDGSYTKRSIRLTKVGIIVYTADNQTLLILDFFLVNEFALRAGLALVQNVG